MKFWKTALVLLLSQGIFADDSTFFNEEDDINALLGEQEPAFDFDESAENTSNPSPDFTDVIFDGDLALPEAEKVLHMKTCIPIVRKHVHEHKELLKNLYTNKSADSTGDSPPISEELENKILDFFALQAMGNCYQNSVISPIHTLPVEELTSERVNQLLTNPYASENKVLRFSPEQNEVFQKAIKQDQEEVKKGGDKTDYSKILGSDYYKTFGSNWSGWFSTLWMLALLAGIATAFFFAYRRLVQFSAPKVSKKSSKRDKKKSN